MSRASPTGSTRSGRTRWIRTHALLLALRYLYSPEGAAVGACSPGLEITDANGATQDCEILLAPADREESQR